MHCANHRRVWTTTHTNGWQAWVAERTDGIYAAGLIGPRPCSQTRYREDFAHAALAAMALLREHTGHVCAPTCAPWLEAEVAATRKR